MKDDFEELFFQMAASAHMEQESACIAAKQAAINQEPDHLPAAHVWDTVLLALEAQQAAQQQAARRKRVTRIALRAACFIVALGIGSITLVTGVDAFRIAVLNFFAEQHEQYTSVRLEPDDQEKPLLEVDIPWEDAYAPTVLPDGYQLISARKLQDSMHMLRYSSGTPEQDIQFRQNSAGANTTVNTEGVEIHDVYINGYKGFWCHQQQYILVVWHNSEYVFVLTLPDSISNFIEIAESVEKVK